MSNMAHKGDYKIFKEKLIIDIVVDKNIEMLSLSS